MKFCVELYILLTILIIFLYYNILFVNCDPIESKIYKSIESEYFCLRRFNVTNQIGCNSKENGNVGVVYLINTEKDINYVIKSGGHSPYIAVITAKYLNLNTLSKFKQNSDRISGVVVLDVSEEERKELKYSPDKSCPNVRLSLYANNSTYGQCAQQTWNLADQSNSEGIMFNDWPFPMFFVKNRTHIDQIKDCFNRFHGPEWPLCAIELLAPMSGAKDSVTCLRRTNFYYIHQSFYCRPLMATNIFNTLLTTTKNDSIANKSIIVVSTRMDSFSMFDSISPGADSAVTSVVVLLSIAETLNKLRSDIMQKSNQKNVLFLLLDGEAWDYIGSSRVVYDMSTGKFPVDPQSSIDLAQILTQHLSHFIELNQLASHESTGNQTLYIHKNFKTNEGIKQLSDLLQYYAKHTPHLDISSISDGQPLPPSSLQTFLKNDNSLVGIVITNHKTNYSNRFYNSLYDDYSNVNKINSKLSKKLTNIATVISKSIYELLTNETKDFWADETTVRQLLDCYLNNSFCNLHKHVSSPVESFSNETSKPISTYVGSNRWYTFKILSYLSGKRLNLKSKDECIEPKNESNTYTYHWMAGPNNNGICVRSQVLLLTDKSPAFTSDEEIINSDLYSTWTQSEFHKHSSVRIFLMPSAFQQWLTLIIGLIVLVVSFALLISFVIIYLPKTETTLTETEVTLKESSHSLDLTTESLST